MTTQADHLYSLIISAIDLMPPEHRVEAWNEACEMADRELWRRTRPPVVAIASESPGLYRFFAPIPPDGGGGIDGSSHGVGGTNTGEPE